ncbi:MAG: 4-hydroxyphenylacetate 3-monooxygenase [Thalassobius sp.]|nr:4-hydroxyphenylacetate 3-monooxygenase [Thalassovita sp.]
MKQSGIDKEMFKEGMSYLTGAVNIVTTDGKGGKGGFTATAVCSVSDTPPTLLVCVNNKTNLADLITENGSFAVNILHAGLEDLSNRFAGYDGVTMEERLLEGDWSTLKTGSPILEDSITSFDCVYDKSIVSGTHTVIFGKIVEVKINKQENPLLYFNRSYRTLL